MTPNNNPNNLNDLEESLKGIIDFFASLQAPPKIETPVDLPKLQGIVNRILKEAGIDKPIHVKEMSTVQWVRDNLTPGIAAFHVDWKTGEYDIRVSPDFMDFAGGRAMEGALAHEIGHFADFLAGNLVPPTMSNTTQIREAERRADAFAARLGYGESLKEDLLEFDRISKATNHEMDTTTHDPSEKRIALIDRIQEETKAKKGRAAHAGRS